MATMLKSRFDVLKVESLSDDESPKVAKKMQQQSAKLKQPKAQSNAEMKGNKKDDKGNKKGNQNDSNNKIGKKATEQQKKVQTPLRETSAKKVQANKRSKKVKETDWEEWKKIDMNATSEAYERDLQEALLASRVEYEQNAGDQVIDNEDSKKKKKKRKEKSVMSLEQFAESGNEAPKDSQSNCQELPTRTLPEGEANPLFFDNIVLDAGSIVRQEKMTEEYQKQYAQESVRVRNLDEKMKRREMEIKMLRTSLEKKEEEFRQVKKRNKQLCCILAQGEMKEKAEILIQAESISQVNSELTEQVTELTADLEKERSKVHTLEALVHTLEERSKNAGGRHNSGK